MLGAIVGDVIGSIYEFNNIDRDLIKNMTKEENIIFSNNLISEQCQFTDDTVCTAAIASILTNNNVHNQNEKNNDKELQNISSEFFIINPKSENFLEIIKDHLDPLDILKTWCRRYSSKGYGANFYDFILNEKRKPYNSFGNGALMRISPVPFLVNNNEKLIPVAKLLTNLSHNHPMSIKFVVMYIEILNLIILQQDTNLANEKVLQYLNDNNYTPKLFKDLLSISYDPFSRISNFYIDCENTFNICISIFLETNNFNEAMIKCIHIGGDVDTNCAITGALMEAKYGVPEELLSKVSKKFINSYNKPILEAIKLIYKTDKAKTFIKNKNLSYYQKYIN